MNKKSYAEKLKDPKWQKKRLEILQRDEFTCQSCFDTKNELHVHHKLYKAGRDPWDYADSELVTLCKGCHKKVSDLSAKIGSLLDFEPYYESFNDLAMLLTGGELIEACITIRYFASRPEALKSVYALIVEEELSNVLAREAK